MLVANGDQWWDKIVRIYNKNASWKYRYIHRLTKPCVRKNISAAIPLGINKLRENPVYTQLLNANVGNNHDFGQQ